MDMAPILQGVRVVDMTQYLAGPTVTRLMAELGADIVKIEQPPYGDPMRTSAIVIDRRSGYFVQQNRGKKSLCIDFDKPEGRKALDALIARADVVVENYGPGVLERRGLDYKTLTERYPKLVMASISGFGKQSSHSHKTAFDLIAQAYSGFMHITGPADGPPMSVGSSVGDVMSGVHALTGIGLALYHREKTGRGQHIDISMVDTLFHVHELAVQGPSLTKGKWRMKRSGARSAILAPAGAYKAPQGYIALQVLHAQWPGFCRAIGRPDLVAAERFVGVRERQVNREELTVLIEDWMATFATDADVLTALEAERVPCAPVVDPADAANMEYFQSRRMVRTVNDPILGDFQIPGNPLRFSEQTNDLVLVAPLLGQHNAEVMRELGYTDADIDALGEDGTLVSSDR